MNDQGTQLSLEVYLRETNTVISSTKAIDSSFLILVEKKGLLANIDGTATLRIQLESSTEECGRV